MMPKPASMMMQNVEASPPRIIGDITSVEIRSEVGNVVRTVDAAEMMAMEHSDKSSANVPPWNW